MDISLKIFFLFNELHLVHVDDSSRYPEAQARAACIVNKKEETNGKWANRRALTSALKLIAVELCELAEDFLLILYSDASSGINHFHSQNTHGIHRDLTHPSRTVQIQQVAQNIDEKYH